MRLPVPVTDSVPWETAGADGERILGDAHHPPAAGGGRSPRATAIVVHGFKGYKDYGMLPALAARLAGAGCVAYRYNASHSGMTNDVATFARPDLFERDTWNRQVEDLRAVVAAARAGTLPDPDPASAGDRPLVLVGHSRGGATCLLAAGRHPELAPAAVVTIAAPADAARVDDEARARLERGEAVESPSARTGQVLRVGPAWWREQREDPEGHDVAVMTGRIDAPVVAIHGTADSTVPAKDAGRIADAARRGRAVLLEGANHVLDTPNPFAADGEPSEALATAIAELVAVLDEVATRD